MYYQMTKTFLIKINKTAEKCWRDMGAFLYDVSSAFFPESFMSPARFAYTEFVFKEAFLSLWLTKSKPSLMKSVHCICAWGWQDSYVSLSQGTGGTAALKQGAGARERLKNREGRCVSLLVAGSHLLLSCLGFSSASYLKVHVKTHHGVPLPQVSRHQESIPNGGAAFHCVRTYGIKGKTLLLCTLLLWAGLCGVGCRAGHEKGEGGRTGKILQRSLGRCREIPEHHVGCHTVIGELI